MSVLRIGSARHASIVRFGLLVLLSILPASAQPIDVPATWGGDVWSRPRLTGSWLGLREERYDNDVASLLVRVTWPAGRRSAPRVAPLRACMRERC